MRLPPLRLLDYVVERRAPSVHRSGNDDSVHHVVAGREEDGAIASARAANYASPRGRSALELGVAGLGDASRGVEVEDIARRLVGVADAAVGRHLDVLVGIEGDGRRDGARAEADGAVLGAARHAGVLAVKLRA